MKIPVSPLGLMKKVYKDVIPLVHENLDYWKLRAGEIPNKELRLQAINSISTKTFHCEGGAIYGILANENIKDSIKFIVAYQTISDYLDNLCDRSTSLDPVDFAALHESMYDALNPCSQSKNYYRYRTEKNDNGYLNELVRTCQTVLDKSEHFDIISPYLNELAMYYCDLQVHKHVRVDERIPRLKSWFNQYKKQLPSMTWYEFSACSGSTLGIFCLVAYAFNRNFSKEKALKIKNGLFPYVQGLHILLDYFIDQEEDKKEGDLNFCAFYPYKDVLVKRMKHFMKEADRQIIHLPDQKFHKLINRGLLGIYLSDQKVKTQEKVYEVAKKILRFGGYKAMFFYLNGRLYRRLQKNRLITH